MVILRVLRYGILAFLAAVMAASADQDRQKAIAPDAAQVPGQGVHAPSESNSDQPVLQTRNPRYRLRWGDTMELKFPITPEFDQTVIIQPDGYINLLQVGDLHVEGKTTSELIEGIRVAYRKLLHEPEITVKLLEFEKPYFVAGGEVGKPGRYDMRGDMTVAQAVNVAGGFTTAAKHSQVLLFRRVSDEWVRVIELDLKKMFNKADLTEDLHLQPGDLVFVPKSRMAKIKEYIPKAMVPSVRF
jgi:polysaccharide biosynthesis/export protein